MNTMQFTIHINAPKEQVWKVMLEDATYREWTTLFMPGSYYEGNWEQGSKIKFLGPDNSGMFAEIAENRPHEFISIRHLGEIQNDIEKPFDTENKAYENYTFTEKNGGTEVQVDMTGVPDEYKGMMNDIWPKALAKLKEIAERQ